MVRRTMVAGVVALMACSGSGSSGDDIEGGLTDGAFDPIDDMERFSSLPPISPEDEVVIMVAERRLEELCMRASGFDYEAPPIGETPPRAPIFLSPDELRRSGYQFDWDAFADEFVALNIDGSIPDPTAGMSDAEVAAFQQALIGDDGMVELQEPGGGTVARPAGGCIGEAQQELYGSVENAIRFGRAAESVSRQTLSDVLQEQEAYTGPSAAWRECMRGAGHDPDESDDYGSAVLGRLQVQRLTDGEGRLAPEEIDAVAEADADCQESSGLFERRRELLPDAQDEVAARLGLQMSDYVAMQHAVLERAKQVR